MELVFREFVNLPMTVSQGLAAKHHRYVGPLFFFISLGVLSHHLDYVCCGILLHPVRALCSDASFIIQAVLNSL